MPGVSPFIWLFLGGVLSLFGFGKWMTAAAVWLAPIFLLQFAYQMPVLSGYLWLVAVLFVALSLSNRDVIPIPGVAYLALMAVNALVSALPFLLDRLFSDHLPGFLATLFFPVVWTALEFLSSRSSPYGTWGASGYTQHGSLALMQLASITGIWGIGFMIAWMAALINWVWLQQFDWAQVQSGVLIFFAVLAVVLLGGGLRLVLAKETKTVRIAGVGWPKGIIEPAQFLRVVEPDFSAAERNAVGAAFLSLHDSFFERSGREARAGAKIIVWPEANLMLFKEDEQAFMQRAQQFAREHEVFLLIGMGLIDSTAARPFENWTLLLSPAGELLYSYLKTTAVPGFESRYSQRGDGRIPLAETPYGRIVSPICFDLDFPWLIRQAGRAHADLMLVPASDWQAISKLHQLMAEWRAVENGVALFRITRWGGSGAVDAYGRRLALMDDFSAEDNVLLAQVPVAAGVPTLYARCGDWFAWSCVVMLAAVIGLAWS